MKKQPNKNKKVDMDNSVNWHYVYESSKTSNKNKSTSFYQKHKTGIIRAIGIGSGIVGLAAGTGLIYGISEAISQKGSYIDLQPFTSPTKSISYASTPTKSTWNSPQSEASTVDVINGLKMDNPESDIKDHNKTFDYNELIINGSQQAVLDKSFNESVYLGTVNWDSQTQFGWNVDLQPNIKMNQLNSPGNKSDPFSARATKPVSDDNTGFINTYTAAIENNTKSLILSGYLHEDPLRNFARVNPNSFSKAGYLMIDGNIGQETYSKNIASVQFRSDEAAFFAGLSACQYLVDNYDNIYSKVNDGVLSIATFGGMAIPTVTVFMGGLEWAIWTFNNFALPNIAKEKGWTPEETDKRTIHLIKNGTKDAFFTGTFTIGDARLMTQELLTLGADVILPVAGPQTTDACAEIQRQGSPCRVIGVDTDQENSDLGEYTSTSPLNKGEKIILCSAQKNLAYLTSIILQASAFGYRGYYINDDGYQMTPLLINQTIADLSEDEQDSLVASYGYSTVGNSDNMGVMVSEAGQADFMKAMGYIFNTTFSNLSDCLDAFSDNEIIPKPDKTIVTLSKLLDENMIFVY